MNVQVSFHYLPPCENPLSHLQWQAFTNPLNPFTNAVGPGFVGST